MNFHIFFSTIWAINFPHSFSQFQKEKCSDHTSSEVARFVRSDGVMPFHEKKKNYTILRVHAFDEEKKRVLQSKWREAPIFKWELETVKRSQGKSILESFRNSPNNVTLRSIFDMKNISQYRYLIRNKVRYLYSVSFYKIRYLYCVYFRSEIYLRSQICLTFGFATCIHLVYLFYSILTILPTKSTSQKIYPPIPLTYIVCLKKQTTARRIFKDFIQVIKLDTFQTFRACFVYNIVFIRFPHLNIMNESHVP